MPESRPLTFLCITTYEKGQEFMRECKREGCRVLLLTALGAHAARHNATASPPSLGKAIAPSA